MAICTDNNQITITTLCKTKDDLSNRIAIGLNTFDSHPGSVARQIESHVGARFFAMARILLGIHHEDGNRKRTQEERKRVSDCTSRLTAGIPRDDNMLGHGPSPMVWQQEKGHPGRQEKRFR